MKKSLYEICRQVSHPGIIELHNTENETGEKPKIILIGDMHMIPGMQRNIARFIIESLKAGSGARLITCESDTGYIPVWTYLKDGTPPTEQVEDGLRQRILKGHEAAAILLDSSISILGIEDPDLYRRAKMSMDTLNYLSDVFRNFRSLANEHFGSNATFQYSMALSSPEHDTVKLLSAILRMMSLEASEEDYTLVLYNKKINTFEAFSGYFGDRFRQNGYEGDLEKVHGLERLFNAAAEFYDTAAKRDMYYAGELIKQAKKVYPSPLLFVVGDIHTRKIFSLLKPHCSEIVYWHPRPGWAGDLGGLFIKEAEDVGV